jgi:hypothetical protein
MKGLLDLFERAGLVKQDSAETLNEQAAHDPQADIPTISDTASLPPAATEVIAGSTPLNLSEIYANEGVPPSVYPAERLLRLLDGLSSMEEPVRRTAIAAMDAADESWSIADPVADAGAKINALSTHAQRLQGSLQALEAETQTRVGELNTRAEQAVGAIRKQIADLEALVAREQERTAKEIAEFEGTLSAAKAQTTLELAEIQKTREQLQRLANEYGVAAPTTQG